MAEIKESVPLVPVQPAKPLRGPAKERKTPSHRGREDRHEEHTKRDQDPDSDHLLDEYV